MANPAFDKASEEEAYNDENGRHIEDKTVHIASTPESQDHSGPAPGPNEREDKATRKLIRKIDIRLLPCLATNWNRWSNAHEAVRLSGIHVSTRFFVRVILFTVARCYVDR